MTMTNDEFVAYRGKKCPVCRSGEVEEYDPEFPRQMYCRKCKAVWEKTHALSGFILLDDGRADP